jgi:hypothetical protein
MGDVFVSAEGYRMAAREFDAPRKTVEDAVPKWERDLAALGAPWGDDEMGQQFSKFYVKGQAETAEGLHDVMDGFTSIIFDLNLMAYNYETAEWSNSS